MAPACVKGWRSKLPLNFLPPEFSITGSRGTVADIFLKTRLLFWKNGKFFCKVHCLFGWPRLCKNLDDQKNRPKVKEFLWK